MAALFNFKRLIGLLTVGALLLNRGAQEVGAQTSSVEVLTVSDGFVVIGRLGLGAQIDITGSNQPASIEDHFQELGASTACVANAGFFESSGHLTLLSIDDGEIIEGQKQLSGFNVRGLYIEGNRAWVSNHIDTAFQGDLIVGLVPQSPDVDGRGSVIVGLADNDVYLAVVRTTVAAAETTLASMGVASSDMVMLDGGGSTQLYCNGQSMVASGRPVPQGIGIFVEKAEVAQPTETATVERSETLYCYYAHTDNNPEWIKPGLRVKQGDIIGIAGDTGYGTGPHLHLGCSRFPPEELEKPEVLKGSDWPWVDPDWNKHPGWIAPTENPVEVGAAYYAANPAGNQAHHTGRDYRGTWGTPLLAVADGEIVWVGHWPTYSEDVVWYRKGQRKVGTGHGTTIVLKIDGQPTTWSAQQSDVTRKTVTVSAGSLLLIGLPLGLLALRKKNYYAYKRVTRGLKKVGNVALYLVLFVDEATLGITRPDRVRRVRALWWGVKGALSMLCCVAVAATITSLNERGVSPYMIAQKAADLSPHIDNFLELDLSTLPEITIIDDSTIVPISPTITTGATYVGVYGAINGWGTLGETSNATEAVKAAKDFAVAQRTWLTGNVVPVVNVRVGSESVITQIIELCSGVCVVMVDVTPNQDVSGLIQTFTPLGEHVWFDIDLEHRGVPTQASEFNAWAKEYFDIRREKGFSGLGVFAFYDFRSEPWLTPPSQVVWSYGENGLVVPIFDGHCQGTPCKESKFGTTRHVLSNYSEAKAQGIMEFSTRWGCGSKYGDCGFSNQEYFEEFRPLIFMSQ